ncbi:glycogen/starch/alpha-glucan phosphorylase [Enterocloster sp.]|uniref:glycogen/starch/alpha-glucan phosphorylase n=1 Tax=Enterocloster sp. TaxID=2719315 RepID=UPI003A95BDE2
MTKKELETALCTACPKAIADCTDKELYTALLAISQQSAAKKKENAGKKKLYYISAEFLIGKLLSNNLINLGLYDDVKAILEENGKSLAAVEEAEPEPSLGNGGLGRLAACFLDSIATLGLNGDGIGLNYHFGLFKQLFKDNKQEEAPNPWIENASWLTKTDVTYQVPYKNFTLTSRMYDIAVTGYHGRTNHLHLFDVESVDESIVEDGISFDKTDVAKNLTLFLYPDDSDREGRILRIYQQYFMVSNAARLILEEAAAKGSNLYDLPDYAVIQINDTHPTMVIPELIRLLTTEHGMEMDDAIEVVSHTCAYTNHTILAEALETWPMEFFKEAVPQLIPIMEVLDDKVRRKFDDPSVYIIDKDDRVHMAHIDIHYGFSVNGVAALHTDILKETELNHFYKIYPEKFNNKTNGITFRRWLLHCNPQLSDFITSFIGEGYKRDADELKKLDQPAISCNLKHLYRLLSIKDQKKAELAQYLKETQGLEINPNSIFDIQIKRLHEYKRQQLNALYLIHKYLEIKKGHKPTTPITAIFGAKAAPAYVIAKDIIHLILCLQQIIKEDPEVSPCLNVVMVNNYNVTLAEKLIPACDISEQISLASKEASGTGNMKFMLNGAVTLGTDDGANVEIHELVGDSNIYIFGDSSDTVIRRYKRGDYHSRSYYENSPALKEAVDFIISKKMLAVGDKENLERLYNELLNKDWFMTFPDFAAYCRTKEKAFSDYEDRASWAKKMLVNISRAGYFSSDRTIEEYNRDIWKL